MTRQSLGPPWAAFLRDIDAALTTNLELHCLGGFVLSVLFDLPRVTSDIDYIAAAPANRTAELEDLGGRGSRLARKHGVYLQLVTVSDFPDDYADSLTDIAPGQFPRLRLRALATEDVVLAKLTRNSPKDIHDVQFLAKRGAIDPDVLAKRYRENLRPYLANVERHDLTLELWLEEIASFRR